MKYLAIFAILFTLLLLSSPAFGYTASKFVSEYGEDISEGQKIKVLVKVKGEPESKDPTKRAKEIRYLQSAVLKFCSFAGATNVKSDSWNNEFTAVVTTSLAQVLEERSDVISVQVIELSLKLGGESSLPNSFQVLDRRNTGLMEYTIPYDLPSGKITDVNVICDGSEVYLLLDNSESTNLTITIPKKMINTIRHDEVDFFIVVNNEETEFEIIDNNPDKLTLQFDIPFVNAETHMFFDSSARTDNWKKENCPYDRLLVMEKPPKIQIKEGVPIERIICYGDLELIFKATDNSPACVKPSTVQKLLVRDWTILGNP